MKNLLTASLAFSAMVAFVLTGSGCTDSAENSQFSVVSETESEHPEENAHGHAAHAHPSEGPHGGDLIELGKEDYHAELAHPEGHDDAHSHGESGHKADGDSDHEADHDHNGITVYILDSAAKNAVPIDAAEIALNLTHDGKPEQFKLAAMPEDGEPAGQSSRFASADKDLLEHFHENDHVEGTLVLKINGTSFRGQLTHKHDNDHKHEGHDHASEKHGSGHDHAGGDALVWRGEPREHEGLQILLGHHGKHLHAGEPVEPAVSITRDGKPAGDVKVFNSLLSADGKNIVAEEVATVFEPTTKDEPAHYAQGALSIPKGAMGVIIRYRIVASDVAEVTFDVPVEVE